MTEPSTARWTSICHLTNQAMDALVEIEQALVAVDDQTLGPLEFRTLVWARCTLATLYGIRADETVDEAVLSDLRLQLEDLWTGSLPAD